MTALDNVTLNNTGTSSSTTEADLLYQPFFEESGDTKAEYKW